MFTAFERTALTRGGAVPDPRKQLVSVYFEDVWDKEACAEVGRVLLRYHGHAYDDTKDATKLSGTWPTLFVMEISKTARGNVHQRYAWILRPQLIGV